MMRQWWSGLVPALVACSDGDPPKRERTTIENRGSVCVKSNADGTLRVVVVFPTCLSGTCDREVGTACSVGVSGSEITITSRGESETTGKRMCTDDCGSLVARCEAAGVPPGNYTLVHGSASSTLTVPGTPVEFGEQAPFDPCTL